MKLCCVVTGEEEAEYYAKLKRGKDYLMCELRIDMLPCERAKKVAQVLKPDIVTCRRKEEGGLFEGSESKRCALLAECAKYAKYADIEHGAEICKRFENLAKSKNPKIKILKSIHSFSPESFSKERFGDILSECDALKIAIVPNDISDVLAMMDFVSRNRNVIAFAMGKKWKFTRIMSLFMGSPWTYVSLGRPVAPGQLSLQQAEEILWRLK